MKLGFRGQSQLLLKMSKTFCDISFKPLPEKFCYKITSDEKENLEIVGSARKIALQKISSSFNKPIIKCAFDTRRINQETERNPRENLQYWNRSQDFIDKESKIKIDRFSKLTLGLNEIKLCYGASPQWHNSYSRTLQETLERTLRIKQGDSDIYGAQLGYVEQLLFARYRLSMEDLDNKSIPELKEIILNKDDLLVKGGIIPLTTMTMQKNSVEMQQPITIQALPMTQNQAKNSLIEAIFGSENMVKKDGEQKVEKTITITIRDL